MEESVIRNVCCMFFSTQWRELHQFGTTIKYTWGWEIVERNSKMVNLTYFHPKRRGIVENKNNRPLNIRFVAKTSDIRNFLENITSDVKSSELATLVWMISAKVVRIFAQIWVNSHCESESWTSTVTTLFVGTICVTASQCCKQWACWYRNGT